MAQNKTRSISPPHNPLSFSGLGFGFKKLNKYPAREYPYFQKARPSLIAPLISNPVALNTKKFIQLAEYPVGLPRG